MKILLTSEFTGLKTTGYSMYYGAIAQALHNGGHKVIELASYGDNNNPEHVEYANTCPWEVYLNIPLNSDERSKEAYEEREKATHDSKFGSWQYEQVCLSEFPDTVISIRDYWYDKFIIDSPLSKYMNVILSPTVDTMPQKDNWLDGFAKADYISSYNQWSEDWLREQYGQPNIVGHIPPAPNPQYKPMDKNLCREKLGLPKDKKIVLTVMRNQGRKKYPELFEAISKLNDKNIVLYCHTHHQDRGWELTKLANQFGIANQVYFSYKCKSCGKIGADKFNISKKCKKCGAEMAICAVHDGAEIEDMKHIYNSCDLYVQYANSEGFGIPVIEAAACGKRVLSINYSAQEDIIPKINGIALKYTRLEREISTSCNRAIPDIGHLVQLLEDSNTWEYDPQEVLNKLNENYSWEKTGQMWLDLVNSIKPKNTWRKDFLTKDPVEYGKLKDLPNASFVKNCIIHVARKPELLGTYIHAEILNHLEIGSYIPEDKFTFQKSNFMVPITKESVYNRLRRIYETELSWEKERLKRLRSLNRM